jgi:ABC-type branched-subunit amino acid transport system permease subunit
MVVMVVLGGLGTVVGPLVGAVALQFLSEYLRTNYLDLHTFIFGAIIIIAVLFLPEGAVNAAREIRRNKRLPLIETLKRNRL